MENDTVVTTLNHVMRFMRRKCIETYSNCQMPSEIFQIDDVYANDKQWQLAYESSSMSQPLICVVLVFRGPCLLYILNRLNK